MSGAIHTLPQYTFMAWCLIKAQGQLYLYLTLTFTDRECEELHSVDTDRNFLVLAAAAGCS